MNIQHNLYQSILQNLSLVPMEYLLQVDNYLQMIIQKNREKETNRKAILALAGTWNDMSEDEFEEFRNDIKNNREDMFNRDIQLIFVVVGIDLSFLKKLWYNNSEKI